MAAAVETAVERIVAAEVGGDDPGAFARKLARENGWSLPRAWRVIGEYKRFAALAVAAGHPVCPSEDVDQAWHLHLLHSRDYWERFCPEILGFPLHHDPARPGGVERVRMVEMYERTLAAYARIFGHPPPPDIWPSAAERFGRDLKARRVNLAGRAVVPALWLAAAVLLLAHAVLRSLVK